MLHARILRYGPLLNTCAPRGPLDECLQQVWIRISMNNLYNIRPQHYSVPKRRCMNVCQNIVNITVHLKKKKNDLQNEKVKLFSHHDIQVREMTQKYLAEVRKVSITLAYIMTGHKTAVTLMPLSQPHMQGFHCVTAVLERDTCQRCAEVHSREEYLHQGRSMGHLKKTNEHQR